ncbi:hypothetical protein ABZ499_23710 [Streptomyces sp. NPDC019990]|uniref:hypothetical protein n=1 Tax=Streptomyces sp. NPDC019990 TaxID=3154693 RepID=UPI0034043501
MRSARMLLATATATAALAIAAPNAFAEAMGDRDHDNTSYSKEHHKDGEHHAPRGGVHTGGGALSVASNDDWDKAKHDEHGKDHEKGKDEHGKDHEKGKDEHGKDHEKGKDEHGKPHGGVHTGGGALSLASNDSWDEGGYHDEKDPYGDEHGKDSYGDKKDEYGKHDAQGKDSYGDKKDEYGKHDEHGKDEYGKHDEHGKDEYGKDEYGKDDEYGKEHYGKDEHEKGWKGEHHKPRGGVHAGGGALASVPGVTAGGLAVLAAAGTGLYALRRQKVSQGTA